MWIPWKSNFQGVEWGGVNKKTNRNGCLKGGLKQLADLIEGLAKKEEWCFFVGDYRIHTMDIKTAA